MSSEEKPRVLLVGPDEPTTVGQQPRSEDRGVFERPLLKDPIERTVDVSTYMPPEVELSVRSRAAIKYVASVLPNPMDELLSDPYFASFGRGLLNEWKKLDCWEQQRTEFQRQWADQVKLKLADELVKMRLKDLEQLDKIIDSADALLPITPPKSWEGVAKVKADAIAKRAAIQDQILRNVTPQVAAPEQGLGSAAALAERAGLTKEQLQEMGRKLLDAGDAPSAASTMLDDSPIIDVGEE